MAELVNRRLPIVVATRLLGRDQLAQMLRDVRRPEVLEAMTRRELARDCAGETEAHRDTAFDELTVARTRQWVAPLEPLLVHGGAFIAVGVRHVIGADGLVELLRARG